MSDTAAPWGRFDDLVTATAIRFGRPDRILTAERPDEVTVVLDEVDRLTRAGRWAFGFVSYEAAPGLDPGLVTHDRVDGLPLVWFGIVDRPERVPPLPRSSNPVSPPAWWIEWGSRRHGAAVDRVRRHISAGEIYQCNLTTRLHAAATPDLDPLGLYRDLVHGQRGAHNAYLDLGRFAVASASPELFFEQRGDRILMRPMKGTAARGRTTAEDAAAVLRLQNSEKERAENVMIVDLVRNDLGRISRPGTVQVTRLLAPERYETVHQLTSDVTARLRPEVGLTEVFRALFPCGSVTGAPKARTMEIIRELEDGERGVYCGAIGVVGPPEAEVHARFSVAIRTALLDRGRGTLSYGTGGGITWSSDPAAEYVELQAKTRVLDRRPDEFSLFETLRHIPGQGLRHLEAHLERIGDSSRYFGIPFRPETAKALLVDRTREIGEARVCLRCSHDGTLQVDVTDAPAPLTRPVRLAVDLEPMDTTTCWSRHKTSLRAPYEKRLARHPDADDVVLVNERGEVMETCTAALAVRIGGRWWTPPLSSGCLPGIERAHLLAQERLTQQVLSPQDLERADAVALLNSLRGWRSAHLITRSGPARLDGPTPTRSPA